MQWHHQQKMKQIQHEDEHDFHFSLIYCSSIGETLLKDMMENAWCMKAYFEPVYNGNLDQVTIFPYFVHYTCTKGHLFLDNLLTTKYMYRISSNKHAGYGSTKQTPILSDPTAINCVNF